MVSIRHQSWLVKVVYENGIGNGNVLWHLGNQGDFTLQGGIDPTDRFYLQRGPSFTTSNTFNKFSLILFDNGKNTSNRIVSTRLPERRNLLSLTWQSIDLAGLNLSWGGWQSVTDTRRHGFGVFQRE